MSKASRHYRSIVPSLLLPWLLVLATPAVEAHGGRLDSKGCHNDRKHGGYHCHRSQKVTPPKSAPGASPLAKPQPAKPKPPPEIAPQPK